MNTATAHAQKQFIELTFVLLLKDLVEYPILCLIAIRRTQKHC